MLTALAAMYRTDVVYRTPGSGPRPRGHAHRAAADSVRLLSLRERRSVDATAVTALEQRRFRDRRDVVPFQRVFGTSRFDRGVSHLGRANANSFSLCVLQPNYAPRLDDVDVKPFVVGAGRTPLDAYVPHHHPHHHHHASPPSLVYAYEEGYSSGSAPTTPLEMHGVDVEHWSYAHGGNGMQDMLAVSCDPIFEPYINL